MKQSKPIVVVKDLRKIYDDKPAVDGISFEVKEGEIFGILGPNGAGKTTTLEMLETLRPIDGGSAILDGLDVSANPDKVKGLIGVQPQTPRRFIELHAPEVDRVAHTQIFGVAAAASHADAAREQV